MSYHSYHLQLIDDYILIVGRDEKRVMQSFKKSNNPTAASNINNNNSSSTSKYYQRSDTPGNSSSNSSSMMNPTPSKDFHRITGIDLDDMKKLR